MPLAIPLPAIRMSGSTPMCSTAHIFPVRPIPDWTSSHTRRIPCRSHSSRSAVNQPSGGTMYPPSPSTGSTTTAATSSGATIRCITKFSMWSIVGNPSAASGTPPGRSRPSP
jgi:hypothetical protein